MRFHPKGVRRISVRLIVEICLVCTIQLNNESKLWCDEKKRTLCSAIIFSFDIWWKGGLRETNINVFHESFYQMPPICILTLTWLEKGEWMGLQTTNKPIFRSVAIILNFWLFVGRKFLISRTVVVWEYFDCNSWLFWMKVCPSFVRENKIDNPNWPNNSFVRFQHQTVNNGHCDKLKPIKKKLFWKWDLRCHKMSFYCRGKNSEKEERTKKFDQPIALRDVMRRELKGIV